MSTDVMNKKTSKKPNLRGVAVTGAGPGRPKGALNKTTRSVKEAIEYAAKGLGGADRMISWAKEDAANERAFWASIYPKLLPLQISGEGGGAVILHLSNADTRI